MPPRKSARGAAAKAAKKIKEEEESEPEISEEEEEDEPKAKKTKKGAKPKAAAKSTKKAPAAKKSTKKKSQAKKKDDEDEDEEEEGSKKSIRKVQVKGKAPVDSECGQASSCHVYFDDEGIWDCMLNQTNIQNNNNKYYLIQLLENDSGGSYFVWMRWGRVGYSGQSSLTSFGGNLDRAKSVFGKKFKDKTLNDWADRELFEKVNGKYDLVKVDYNPDEEDGVDSVDGKVKKEEKDAKPAAPVPDSKLHPQLQQLIKLIGDVKNMEQTVMEMEYDAKKAPLGKITAEQLRAGYDALKEISELIKNGKTSGSNLLQACNDFYTRIPHEFGMRVPPLIKTVEVVKKKIELLEALGDIQVAMKIISNKAEVDCNPLDHYYNQLNCDISYLDPKTADYKTIENYIQSTHAKTHSMYTMKVLDVFECAKQMETDRFQDKGNRMLLFHGSRISNWTGILSTGLRIAPPEAPVTGYMFGKGVYFADMSSKSANYCWPSRSQDVGILMLCEVAIGKPNQLLRADYNASNLPKGTHSTQGMGSVAPDPKKAVKLSDGTIVPMGPGVDTKVKNPQGYTLNYNEFIVYDLAQIKMRYMAKIKFNFK